MTGGRLPRAAVLSLEAAVASALGGAGTPVTRLYESADAARDQQVSFLALKRLCLMVNPG